jgi:ketosteroid isomerase-like protein
MNTFTMSHTSRASRRPSVIVVSICLSLLISCASSPEARVAKEIQEEYDKLAAAFDRQDIDAVLSFRLPTFETFGPDGQHNNAAEMAEYTRNWLLVQNKPPIESRFTILSLELRSPTEAAVTVVQRVSRYQDREGKRVHVEHEVTQRETWNRTPQGWKLRKVDQIDLKHRKRWVDGQLQPNPS